MSEQDSSVSDSLFAPIHNGPCYAVIFTNQREPEDLGYGAMADHMAHLASQQPGYLGAESVRDASGYGITISYWESEAAIASWKAVAEHAGAREKGRSDWYARYITRVAKVERAYSWSKP